MVIFRIFSRFPCSVYIDNIVMSGGMDTPLTVLLVRFDIDLVVIFHFSFRFSYAAYTDNLLRFGGMDIPSDGPVGPV